MTRVFFATDVHGSERAFRKFVSAGPFYKAGIVILGGDITGKMMVPIVKKNENTYDAHYYQNKVELHNQKELEKFENECKNSGYYPYHCSEDVLATITTDREKAGTILFQLMKERLEAWIKLIEEKLRGTEVKIYITGGNDDPYEVESILRTSDFIIDPEGQVVKIDENKEMISSGFSNPTPWKTPREVSEERLRDEIEKMTSKVQDMKNCIFNIHVPPKDSQLDTCPKLDESVYPPKPILKEGRLVEFGAGSSSVRLAIEKNQPLLTLCGHIHESRGAIKIGRTVCINPGSEYQEGILRGAIIDLKKDKIDDYQLTSG
ncbi:MAG: metallophosphoesterase [Candidatus Bathyarchaeia archaeon]